MKQLFIVFQVFLILLNCVIVESITTRYEIREMSPDQLDSYFNALVMLYFLIAVYLMLY